MENYFINSFSNGKSFFQYSKKWKTDIIFLDYHLPDTTGLEVLKFIKTEAPDAKVIIISAQDNTHVATDLVDLGIYGYITKDSGWKSKVAQYMKELE